MKLKSIQNYPAAKLKGRISGDLHQALTAYAGYYRETTGQTIELWALLVQMIEQFMDSDREFQTWRRRPQSAPGAEPMTG